MEKKDDKTKSASECNLPVFKQTAVLITSIKNFERRVVVQTDSFREMQLVRRSET